MSTATTVQIPVFNPFDTAVIKRTILNELNAVEPLPLQQITDVKFELNGIYALYYHGDFQCYQSISGTAAPIYAGRGDGHVRQRLLRHRHSIVAAQNLDIQHFSFRLLALPVEFIGFGERAIIEIGTPWNSRGFGNNPQGSGRSAQVRSEWDTLHPGRSWADALTAANAKSAEQIAQDITVELA